MLSSEDVLFVGKSVGVVSWYRTGMPAFHTGCDWAGLEGEPGHLRMVTSLKRGGHVSPVLDDYKIIVLQQVKGRRWVGEIARLQKKGIKVLYEVDDYLHGVRKIQSHRAKAAFSKKLLPDYEICMRQSDGLICSTDWLADAYRKFNRRVFTARNFIQGPRYSRFKLPERKTINIGWAGGEGHLEVVSSWLSAVEQILDEFENTRFISMGLPVADLLKRPKQCLSLPFIGIENFPSALTNFDIAIAPAGRGGFYAAKSDLRFLETGALGIPLVADPFVYGEIVDGNTGMAAEGPEGAYQSMKALIEQPKLRSFISQQARTHVLANRSIEQAEQWENIFVAVWDS